MRLIRIVTIGLMLGSLTVTCDGLQNPVNNPPNSVSQWPYGIRCTCWNYDTDEWITEYFDYPTGAGASYIPSDLVDECESRMNDYLQKTGPSPDIAGVAHCQYQLVYATN
jgi:hypothetical protein